MTIGAKELRVGDRVRSHDSRRESFVEGRLIDIAPPYLVIEVERDVYRGEPVAQGPAPGFSMRKIVRAMIDLGAEDWAGRIEKLDEPENESAPSSRSES